MEIVLIPLGIFLIIVGGMLMMDDLTIFGLVFIAVGGFCIGFVFNNISNEYTPIIEECEKHLIREEHCVLIAVPEKTLEEK